MLSFGLNKLSIRLKLIIVYAGLILFSVGVTSVFQIYQGKKILQSRILSDLSAIVKSRKDLIINLFESHINSVSANSSRRLPRGYLVKYRENDPRVEEARIEAFKTLHDVILADHSVKKIDVLDMSGKVMISTDAGSVGKDLSSSQLFLKGRDGVNVGKTYFKDDKFCVDIAVPTYNPVKEERETVGVFITSVDVDRVIDFLKDYHGLGESGEVVIARREGDDITYINPLRHVASPPLAYRIPFNALNAKPMREGLAGGKGILAGLDYRGKEVLAAYDYIPVTGWAIVAKIDLNEAFLPVRDLFSKNLIIVFLVFIVSVTFVVLFSYIFLDPIRKLSRMTAVIARGDFDSRVDIKQADEIGELGKLFNSMAQSLKSITTSRDELNIEVKKRRDAEEEVRDAYEQLKEVEVKLVQSSKMASLGQLAGGVAHEINNPLTGVLNNVQLIKMISASKKELKPEEFNDILDIIEESALRCKRITHSLLDFTHASKGEFRPVNLNAVIDKVLLIISTEIKLSNIEIVKELKPDLDDINGDPQLLPQVIMGLVGNAKWAIDKKGSGIGGVITIKTWQDPQSKNVMVSVSDNGVGIPKENIQKIFEPFFTTKDVGEGTGLGLALIYNIVHNHKGEITVESAPNTGTTFKAGFPSV